jgi:hypothetical protein
VVEEEEEGKWRRMRRWICKRRKRKKIRRKKTIGRKGRGKLDGTGSEGREE